MTEMYQCREIVFWGQFFKGTSDPRKFVRRHIVSGLPDTPPDFFVNTGAGRPQV